MKLFDNGKIPLGDFLEACQYCYWMSRKPLISDERYDSLKERCKTPPKDLPPRKGVVFYPSHIRYLALYLQSKRTGEDETSREQAQKLIDQEERLSRRERR